MYGPTSIEDFYRQDTNHRVQCAIDGIVYDFRDDPDYDPYYRN